MNQADKQLKNTITKHIIDQLIDDFPYWVSWASQMPDETEMTGVEPSSEAIAFIVDYMLECIEDGNTEFLATLDEGYYESDEVVSAMCVWMESKWGSVSFTPSGSIWMNGDQAGVLFDIYEQAIKEIAKREITRGI